MCIFSLEIRAVSLAAIGLSLIGKRYLSGQSIARGVGPRVDPFGWRLKSATILERHDP
jgi:hypothetical protein